MREVLHTIAKTRAADLPVLIRGETGTGKELIARYVHTHSHLRDMPFVKVNCAAIPALLLESELLGYVKGAFTGATETKPGLVEMASGGTLFLDEIGDMEPSLQSKLLHLLQDGRYTPVGAGEERRARARIICATHCELEQAMVEGSFRSDLFYRLDGITLQLSPLRDRREDIPALCEYFREQMRLRYLRRAMPLAALTLYVISQWRWPGNIRQLEGWVLRQVVLGEHQALNLELSRQCASAETPAGELHGDGHLKPASRKSAQAAEFALILRRLAANHWNRRAAAQDLKISYRSLMYKLRDAGFPSTRRKTT